MTSWAPPWGTPSLQLDALRLRNFKSVAAAEVELSPLTVILGANSSGKSTLMQALLVLTQGLRSGIEGATFPISGDLFRPGGFSDVVSAFASDDDLQIGISLRTQRTRGPRRMFDHTRFAWDVALRGAAEDEPGSSIIQWVRFTAGSPDQPAALSYETNQIDTAQSLSEYDVEAGTERRLAGSLRHGPDARPIATVSTSLYSGLPRGGMVKRPEGVVLAETWIDTVVDWLQAIDVEDPDTDRIDGDSEVLDPEALESMLEEWAQWAVRDIAHFRATHAEPTRRGFQEFLYERLDQLEEIDPVSATLLAAQRPRLTRLVEERVGSGRDVAVRLDELMLRRLFQAASQYTSLFELIRWLGPIRLEPQPVYPTSGAARTGAIGPRGEHTAAVFRAFRHESISYIRPGGRRGQSRLEQAVIEWARELGLVEGVTAEDLPRLGLDVRVQPPGLTARLDLTAVGVGVSQLLPVLVLCLLTPRGSVILLEQPELHLHPGVQLDLADFLLATAEAGKQVIVETHSEHLVQRLRRRIAEAPGRRDEELADMIGFVFAERDAGVTTYRNIRPNRFGGLEGWPSGFFANGAEEARDLLEAGLRKRAETDG